MGYFTDNDEVKYEKCIIVNLARVTSGTLRFDDKQLNIFKLYQIKWWNNILWSMYLLKYVCILVCKFNMKSRTTAIEVM